MVCGIIKGGLTISPCGLLFTIRSIYSYKLALRLLFLISSGCLVAMSSIPQGAFAALKVRQTVSDNKKFGFSSFKEEKQTIVYPPVNKKLVEASPLKYNSKMMNSIWGQYNRYSVHNLKKNIDANEVQLWEKQNRCSASPSSRSTHQSFNFKFLNTN